jgi:hypothetical protein
MIAPGTKIASKQQGELTMTEKIEMKRRPALHNEVLH